MTKTLYMTELRRELDGLPLDLVEKTLGEFEKKFVDGIAAGRNEAEIAANLPTPGLVAAQRRAAVHFQTLRKTARPGNFFGLLMALLGLMVLNFFLVVPALACCIALFASYLSSLVLYAAGIVIVAASLSGVDQMKIDLPSHQQSSSHWIDGGDFSDHQEHTNVTLTATGIYADTEDSNSEERLDDHALDKKPVHINVINEVKSAYLFRGIGFVLGGIALLMLCLLLTRYAVIGFKNYIRWNFSLLHQRAAA